MLELISWTLYLSQALCSGLDSKKSRLYTSPSYHLHTSLNPNTVSACTLKNINLLSSRLQNWDVSRNVLINHQATGTLSSFQHSRALSSSVAWTKWTKGVLWSVRPSGMSSTWKGLSQLRCEFLDVIDRGLWQALDFSTDTVLQPDFALLEEEQMWEKDKLS